MVENMLLSLPPDISCSILMKWIMLKDFVGVDSAHCRISCWRSLCQSAFLMLSHDLKRMKSKPAESSEVNLGTWLMSRKIRTTAFIINPNVIKSTDLLNRMDSKLFQCYDCQSADDLRSCLLGAPQYDSIIRYLL